MTQAIKIYHNQKCGTSRNTLALIRNTGIEPQIINYLETPPSEADLTQLINDMGVPVREVIRTKEPLYKELGMDQEGLSDEALIKLMVAHPILINRPIVVTEKGTRLCRPSEEVLDILPLPQQGAFNKEDGEAVIDAQGQQVKE